MPFHTFPLFIPGLINSSEVIQLIVLKRWSNNPHFWWQLILLPSHIIENLHLLELKSIKIVFDWIRKVLKISEIASVFGKVLQFFVQSCDISPEISDSMKQFLVLFIPLKIAFFLTTCQFMHFMLEKGSFAKCQKFEWVLILYANLVTDRVVLFFPIRLFFKGG